MATAAPPYVSVSTPLVQVSAVPPGPVNVALAHSCTDEPAVLELEKKFDSDVLGEVPHDVPFGTIHTSPTCGAGGAVAGTPGVPVLLQTRV
jgi:hypothetical protein